MLVSIIVPVYNAEKYLDRCMQSLVEQSYMDIEIVIVNDGSTDSSEEIIKKYMAIDNRIVYLNKENGGAASAVSCGVQGANGQYITFVDADDYVGADFVETFVANLEDNDVLSMGFYFDSGKNIIPFNLKNDCIYQNEQLPVLKSKFIFDGYLGISNNVFVARWNKIYKKDILKRFINLYKNLDLRLYEDSFFTLLLLSENVKIKTLKCPNSYYYNISNQSVTRRLKGVEEYEELIDKLLFAENYLIERNINCYNISDILISYAGMEYIKDYAITLDPKKAIKYINLIVTNIAFQKSLNFYSHRFVKLKSRIKLFLCKHKTSKLLYYLMK